MTKLLRFAVLSMYILLVSLPLPIRIHASAEICPSNNELTIATNPSSEVRQVAQIGRGEVNDLVWASDDVLVIATTAGVWVQSIDAEMNTCLYDEHRSPVDDLDYNPVTRTVASAGFDGTVRLWDPFTLETRQTLEHHQAVRRVVFSADGRTIATVSGVFITRSNLDVWDAETGSHIHQLIRSDWIESDHQLALNSDGSILAFADYRDILIWDTEQGQQLFQLPHDSGVAAIRFLPGSSLLLSYTEDGSVYLWNTETGSTEQLNIIAPETDRGDRAVLIDEDHLLRVIGNEVYLTDLQTMDTGLFSTHDSPIQAIALNPNDGLFAVATASSVIEILDVTANGSPIMLDGFLAPIVRMSVDDGNIVATAHTDGSVNVWDWTTQTSLFSTRGFLDVGALALNGDQLAIGALTREREDVLILLDYQQQQELERWYFEVTPGEGNGVTGVLLNDDYLIYRVTDIDIDDNLRAFISDNDHIGIIDLAGETQQRIPLDVEDSRPLTMRFTPPDEQVILVGGRGDFTPGTLYTLNLSSLTLTSEFDLEPPVGTDLAIDERGCFFALFISGESGSVNLVDLTTMTTIAEYVDSRIDGTSRLALNPDGTILAVATWMNIARTSQEDDYIILWEVETGDVLAQLNGHTAAIVGLEFTRDGYYLISGGFDGTVRVWAVNFANDQ
jgi:WD40 repeat protein